MCSIGSARRRRVKSAAEAARVPHTATLAVAALSNTGRPPRTDAGLAWTKAADEATEESSSREGGDRARHHGFDDVWAFRSSTWRGKGEAYVCIGVWIVVRGWVCVCRWTKAGRKEASSQQAASSKHAFRHDLTGG